MSSAVEIIPIKNKYNYNINKNSIEYKQDSISKGLYEIINDISEMIEIVKSK